MAFEIAFMYNTNTHTLTHTTIIIITYGVNTCVSTISPVNWADLNENLCVCAVLDYHCWTLQLFRIICRCVFYSYWPNNWLNEPELHLFFQVKNLRIWSEYSRENRYYRNASISITIIATIANWSNQFTYVRMRTYVYGNIWLCMYVAEDEWE